MSAGCLLFGIVTGASMIYLRSKGINTEWDGAGLMTILGSTGAGFYYLGRARGMLK